MVRRPQVRQPPDANADEEIAVIAFHIHTSASRITRERPRNIGQNETTLTNDQSDGDSQRRDETDRQRERAAMHAQLEGKRRAHVAHERANRVRQHDPNLPTRGEHVRRRGVGIASSECVWKEYVGEDQMSSYFDEAREQTDFMATQIATVLARVEQ